MAAQQIGPFQIEKQLGAGGMGVVYLATYLKTGQKVALKVLTQAMSKDNNLLARFEREMKILKKLQHENIVRYYGGGKKDNQHFYAMELLKGGSLEDLLNRKKKLPWEQVIDLSLQIAGALEYAHQHSVIHRDLKPANLFFGKDEKLKLGDFGIARDTQATALTAAGKTVGTYAYMAPEQISGEHAVSGKTDLYSLGCVMYQMLTGKTPFEADTAAQMLFKHLEQKPPRVTAVAIDCPIWLESVVTKLLAKNPEDRYFDALALQVALEEVGKKVAEQTSIAKQTTTGGPTAVTIEDVHPELKKLLTSSDRKKKRKRKRKKFVPFYERIWFLLVCLILLAGGVAWAMWPLSEEELFARAEELMNTEDTANWREAREEYLDPYLERFPDGKHIESVRKHVDTIEMDVAERRAETTLKFNREPKSEAERIYVEALLHERARDRLTALARYRGLIDLYRDSEKDKAFVNLAKKKVEQLRPSLLEGENVLNVINEALQRAEEHSDKGDKLKADEIWSSIISIYGENREFEVQVKYARDRRAGQDVELLDFGQPEEKNKP